MKDKAQMNPKDSYGKGVVSDRVQNLVHFLNPQDRILDYGCGQGAYVEYLIKSGFDAYGVDIFEYPLWQERSKSLGISGNDIFQVINVTGNGLYQNKPYDVVYSFEVLEHCPDPQSVLKNIHDLTKRLYICSVPDCGYSKIYQGSFGFHHWTDTSHVNYFSRESIASLLQSSGFNVLAVMGSFPIDFHSFYWNKVALPKTLRNGMKYIMNTLKAIPNEYYSSILVVCGKKKYENK